MPANTAHRLPSGAAWRPGSQEPLETVTPEDLGTAGYFEVSTAVRLLGDRWSLLIVREIWAGNTRYNEIHSALPGLSRSLLSARLRYLERLLVIERRDNNDTDRRSKLLYSLSEAGSDLVPVIRALGLWALTWQVPERSEAGGDVVAALRAMQASIDLSTMPKDRMSVQLYFTDSSHSAGYLRVDRTGARGCLGVTDETPDLVVRTSAATLQDLYWGHSSCREALFRREISFEGPVAYAQTFPSWFPDRPANGVVASTP